MRVCSPPPQAAAFRGLTERAVIGSCLSRLVPGLGMDEGMPQRDWQLRCGTLIQLTIDARQNEHDAWALP